nr:DUF4365 domain-containing protein [Nitrosomonas nitrosa]
MSHQLKRNKQGHQNNYAGVSAESFISGVLQQWGWATSKPAPDVGTDLIVQTGTITSPGVLIALQVKSTKSRRASISLNHHTASRLRDQPPPAFLFALDRRYNHIYWVYLEPLFRTDEPFLQGKPLRVAISEENRFNITDADCPAKLLAVLEAARPRGAVKLIPRLRDHARELERYYFEMDPRLRVTPTLSHTGERYSIRAVRESVPLTFSVKSPDPSTGVRLRELMDWGSDLDVPATVAVDGSSVFRELWASHSFGRLRLVAEPAWSGTGLLGAEGNPPMGVQVTHRQGKAGAEWILSIAGGAFVCRCRFPYSLLNGDSDGVTASVTIDYHQICGIAARDLHKLRGLGALMRTFLSGGARAQLRLLEHPKSRDIIPMPWQLADRDGFQDHLGNIDALESLAWIADELKIELDSNPLGNVSCEEMQSWREAAALLRGARLPMSLAVMRCESDMSRDDAARLTAYDGMLVVRTAWSLMLRNVAIAEISVRIDYENYRCEVEEAPGGCVVVARPKDESSARYLSKW